MTAKSAKVNYMHLVKFCRSVSSICTCHLFEEEIHNPGTPPVAAVYSRHHKVGSDTSLNQVTQCDAPRQQQGCASAHLRVLVEVFHQVVEQYRASKPARILNSQIIVIY